MSFRLRPISGGATIGGAIGTYTYGLPGFAYGILAGGFLASSAEFFLQGDSDMTYTKISAVFVALLASFFCYQRYVYNNQNRPHFRVDPHNYYPENLFSHFKLK